MPTIRRVGWWCLAVTLGALLGAGWWTGSFSFYLRILRNGWLSECL